MEYYAAKFEIKRLDPESGRPGDFTGLVSIYNIPDRIGDVVRPGAFTKTLQENNGKAWPLLWHHDPKEPIGEAHLTDSPKGMVIEGNVDVELGAVAQKAYRASKKGIVRGLSFGYQTIKATPYPEGPGGPRRALDEVKMFEQSMVTIPCHQDAGIDAIKAFEGDALAYHLAEIAKLVGRPENEIKSLILGTAGPDQPTADQEPIKDHSWAELVSAARTILQG